MPTLEKDSILSDNILEENRKISSKINAQNFVKETQEEVDMYFTRLGELILALSLKPAKTTEEYKNKAEEIEETLQLLRKVLILGSSVAFNISRMNIMNTVGMEKPELLNTMRADEYNLEILRAEIVHIDKIMESDYMPLLQKINNYITKTTSNMLQEMFSNKSEDTKVN